MNDTKVEDEIKKLIIDNGADIVGIGKIFGLYVISFGIQYSNNVVEQLPNDSELLQERNKLRDKAAVIYKKVEEYIKYVNSNLSFYRMNDIHKRLDIDLETYNQKALAVISGIGWIGKSSLLITEEYGPRLRLGTMFTDMKMNIDKPIRESYCGDCNECIKACPAGAINHFEWVYRKNEEMIDKDICIKHLEKNLNIEGKRAYCGICMKICPVGYQSVN